jgi:ATP-binding cassette subfamily F protein uup
VNDLSVSGLTRSLGERVLFENLSFGLEQGQRVALIARNGAGKTTLMNIIAGLDSADSGEVKIRREVRVGYLSQQPVFDADLTVLQVVLQADTAAQRAVAAYELAMDRAELDPTNPSAQKGLEVALSEVDHLNAWDYEAEVKAVLSRLNIHHLEQRYGSLSGGQQRRVALARVLLQRPELYLLDEPTNHLDLDMVEWLEGYLKSRRATLLLVTHDRYFLEALCEDIFELANGTLYSYRGSYADYLEGKAAREASTLASAEKARNLLRTELEWMRRQPKARGTKSQARINAFYELETKAAKPVEGPSLQLEAQMSRMGNSILELKHLEKAHGGRTLISDFSYTFRRGERIGLVGPNGAGKSTLLDLITGKQQPDSGTVKVGETIVFGYYTQTGLSFKPGERVIDIVKAIAEHIVVGRDETLSAELFLKRFQFEPARQYTPVELLSGGERRRLHLLTILIRQPNFLILDEPTNDLDLPTLQVLEDFLQSFGGCLIVVTHDRYFLDRLVDHLLIFEGKGNLRDWNGNYTDYRAWRDAQGTVGSTSAYAAPQPVAVVTATAPSRKLSFKKQKELQQLESEIAHLELQLQSHTANMQAADHALAAQAAAAYQETQTSLEAKTLRWMELSE